MNEGTVIARRWKISRKLGSGSFGTVYAARRISNDAPVAIKTERISQNESRVETEFEMYEWIHNSPPDEEVNGIPMAHYFGRHGSYNVLVIDRLGPSLQDLMVEYGTLSLKSVFMIGLQALRRLELIHTKSVLHRDIKPDNMLMGLRDKKKLHLVDFGLAEHFRHPYSKVHYQFRRGVENTIALDFGPTNGHKGYTLSRRDDLESLGFVLVYLRKGRLPWMNMRTFGRNRERMVATKKYSTSIYDLCRGLPDELGEYFYHIRDLQFDERPNYSLLRQLFREGLANIGKSEDFRFEWTAGPSLRRSRSARHR